jgi:hypothetical protein
MCISQLALRTGKMRSQALVSCGPGMIFFLSFSSLGKGKTLAEGQTGVGHSRVTT